MEHNKYITQIIHDIRNTRELTPLQMNYVLSVNEADKNEILVMMNESLQALHEYLLECVK